MHDIEFLPSIMPYAGVGELAPESIPEPTIIEHTMYVPVHQKKSLYLYAFWAVLIYAFILTIALVVR